jgi:ligand-binding SRPBCC domain-containing protein
MVHRFQFEQWVPAPLESVFRFFADPNNLPRLMPPWMQVRLETQRIVSPNLAANHRFAGVGSVLTASYRTTPFLPFRITSEAQITGFGPNEYFEDIQGKGPFKSWHHRHDFLRELRNGVDGTIVRDKIEYDPGFGPLGSVANSLFIAPQMRSTFKYRQKTLDSLVRRGELKASAQ